MFSASVLLAAWHTFQGLSMGAMALVIWHKANFTQTDDDATLNYLYGTDSLECFDTKCVLCAAAFRVPGVVIDTNSTWRACTSPVAML